MSDTKSPWYKLTLKKAIAAVIMVGAVLVGIFHDQIPVDQAIDTGHELIEKVMPAEEAAPAVDATTAPAAPEVPAEPAPAESIAVECTPSASSQPASFFPGSGNNTYTL